MVIDSRKLANMAGKQLASLEHLAYQDRSAYQPHSLSNYKHQGLVCDRVWGSEEEEAECDVEEREGCNDCSP